MINAMWKAIKLHEKSSHGSNRSFKFKQFLQGGGNYKNDFLKLKKTSLSALLNTIFSTQLPNPKMKIVN
jgi:hypothetical protein